MLVFLSFRLFVGRRVRACPMKSYFELRHVVSLLAGSQSRRCCQLARHSHLSSYFNMFVSCMQMLSSRCFHSVLDSAKHTHGQPHKATQTEIYCVISAAEGLRQIKERKKRLFSKKERTLRT